MSTVELSIQPAYDYNTNQIGYAEVLVRRYMNIHGVQRILKYIEDTESEVEFDLDVLKETIKYIKKYPDLGYPIGFNVCSRTIREYGIADKIINMVEEACIDASKLVIEINEKTDFTDETTIYNIKKMHGHGIIVALDDFGTDKSNFGALQEDIFDILKIDKRFIDYVNSSDVDIEEDESSSGKILTAIVNLCKGLGIKSVVEGVETNKQLSYMKRLGCDYAQGYAISKPVPLEEFSESNKNN